MTSAVPARLLCVRRDLPGVVVLVGADGEEVASWALPASVGLEAVDDLARLQLAARREGLSIRLRRLSPALSELLELAGLAEVLPCAALREVRGEPERGEEAGVEEAVVPDDPVA